MKKNVTNETKRASKKKTEERPKNTTNYAPDDHKKFCARCYARHGKTCPATKSMARSSACNL